MFGCLHIVCDARKRLRTDSFTNRSSIGQSELEIEAYTLNDVVDWLVERQSSLKEALFDFDGGLRCYTLFYVNK